VVSNAVSDNTANAIVRRDGSGNFSAGTIILSGHLGLPRTTSASAGVLTLGGIPFLHNFGNNTFVGDYAGNLTMTGAKNTGVGFDALNSNTTGGLNSAFGQDALALNTTGSGNAAFGAFALGHNTASGNTAFGSWALYSNTTGDHNTAFGNWALYSSTTGAANTAFGSFTLFSNTGSENSAFGSGALGANTTGGFNSAFAGGALQSNTTGGANSAFGTGALGANTTGGSNSAFGQATLLKSTGDGNTAFGESALGGLVSGNNNIAIGMNAGGSFTGSESNNIDVGNQGTIGESNAIHIGDVTTQTAAFIAGINGATSPNGVVVFVNSNGQLGTLLSSRRYKQQIADLDGESDVLMKLRPVAFYYKPELDSSHTRQYGLVAEEVAQIAPGLVVFDRDGKPQTVRYHFVNAMLLNEVQKQKKLIEAQQKANEEQRGIIAQQEMQIRAMQSQLKEVMLHLTAVEKSVPRTQLAGAEEEQ
jgi:hypothetical protein